MTLKHIVDIALVVVVGVIGSIFTYLFYRAVVLLEVIVRVTSG